MTLQISGIKHSEDYQAEKSQKKKPSAYTKALAVPTFRAEP